MRGGATCFDGDHAAVEDLEHEDEAYCMKCGLTIRWDESREKWYEDESLVALVLTRDELQTAQRNLGYNAWGIGRDLESLRRKVNIPQPEDWNPESARADLRSE